MSSATHEKVANLLARFEAGQLVWKVPALVRRRDEVRPITENRSYHTRLASTDASEEAARRLRNNEGSQTGNSSSVSDDELAIDDVLAIRKRSMGGPFPDRIGIGRAPNVDVHVPLPRISKYHAYITIEGDVVKICDAKSTFGTTVDGVALVPLEPKELNDGAVINFGPYSFRFHTARGLLRYVETLAKVKSRGR